MGVPDCYWDCETPDGEATCFGTQRRTEPLNSTRIDSSQVEPRPNWTLTGEDATEEENEEHAEASLLETLEENSVHEDHIEAEDDEATDHGEATVTVPPDHVAQPVTVQALGEEVGRARQRVVVSGDISQTTFPPPEFCSGCGFIGQGTKAGLGRHKKKYGEPLGTYSLKDLTWFRCSLCGFIAGSAKGLTTHQKSVRT